MLGPQGALPPQPAGEQLWAVPPLLRPPATDGTQSASGLPPFLHYLPAANLIGTRDPDGDETAKQGAVQGLYLTALPPASPAGHGGAAADDADATANAAKVTSTSSEAGGPAAVLAERPGAVEDPISEVTVTETAAAFEGFDRFLVHTIQVQLSPSTGASAYTVRRRYRDVKALHAALRALNPKATLPPLPPAEPRFFLQPSEKLLTARAKAVQGYLQQLAALVDLTRTVAYERFLDLAGRVRRPRLERGVPPTLFYAAQALLPHRLPVPTRVDIGQRACRAGSRTFALELLLHRRHAGGPTGLVLIAAAATPATAAAWLDELHSLVREAAAGCCRHLTMSAIAVPEQELRAFCAPPALLTVPPSAHQPPAVTQAAAVSSPAAPMTRQLSGRI